MAEVQSNQAQMQKPLLISLWVAQLVVATLFIWLGCYKFLAPIPVLAKFIPWAGQLPVPFVRTIGLIDITGGLGLVLPGLTRVAPGLTTWAALGCSVLQVCAITFHVSRGEVSATPFNLVLLALSIFILWGRNRQLPLGRSLTAKSLKRT